jgi:hypothetical protein
MIGLRTSSEKLNTALTRLTNGQITYDESCAPADQWNYTSKHSGKPGRHDRNCKTAEIPGSDPLISMALSSEGIHTISLVACLYVSAVNLITISPKRTQS